MQFQLVPLFELLDGGLEVTAHLPPRGLESFTVFGLVGFLGGLPVLEMNLSGKFNELCWSSVCRSRSMSFKFPDFKKLKGFCVEWMD